MRSLKCVSLLPALMPAHHADRDTLHALLRTGAPFDPGTYLEEVDRLEALFDGQPLTNADIAALAENPYAVHGFNAEEFCLLDLPVPERLDDNIIAATAPRAQQDPQPEPQPELILIEDTQQAPQHVDTPLSGAIYDNITAEGFEELITNNVQFLGSDDITDMFSGAVVQLDDSDDEVMPPLQGGSDAGDEPQVIELDEDQDPFEEFMRAHSAAPAAKRRRIRGKREPPPPWTTPNLNDGEPSPQRPLGMPSQKLKAAAASRGLAPKAFKRMVLCGFPLIFMNALVLIQNFFPSSESTRTDVSELFSGVAYVAEAWTGAGLEASVYDILRHPVMEDILSPEGFLTAMRNVKNIREGGVLHVATVCSTWVYICRATTGRSVSKPLGNRREPLTEEANTMAARVALLLAFAACCLVWFIHEQPLSSLLPVTKFFLWSKNVLRGTLQGLWREVFTWLGAYGHETWKPTQLLSNAPWSAGLYKALTREQRFLLKPDTGVRHLPADPTTLRRRIAGASGLKSSQAYPKDYGLEVHRQWSMRDNLVPDAIDFDEIDSDEEVPWSEWQAVRRACDWKELKLHELTDVLGVPGGYPLP